MSEYHSSRDHCQLEESILGNSPAIQHVRALIRRVAGSSLSVLVQGPTGSGKELVAEAIHRLSGRQGRLVAFNVAAIADTLFEDALFGHAKGAYSGASEAVRGYLPEANGGSLFLDEISALGIDSQAKLLRVLETGTCRPLGSSADRHSDFRIIAASNEALPHLITAGRFRSDLLYRLAGVVIRVPSLRDRVEDIPMLAQRFLAEANRMDGVDVSIAESAMQLLKHQPWEGNVRELRQVIRGACVLVSDRVITEKDLEPILGDRRDALPRMTVDDARLANLLRTLETHRWRIGAAAQALGVHRTTLFRWMRGAGLSQPRSARVVDSSPIALLRGDAT